MLNTIHTESRQSSVALAESAVEASAGKHFPRRTAPDRSQPIRLVVQLLFVLLNVFLCAQFYWFVRYFQTNQTGSHVSRPAGVDGWLPIAGLMNLRYFLATGRVPAIHPAAMVLFLIFVAMSLLLKRAFCSWLCPVGTFSEYLWKAGRRLFGRNLVLPRWLDIPLRSIKYLLMAFFVVIIGGMSAAALEDFMAQPYGILADVKMLHFFLHMSTTAMAVIAVSGAALRRHQEFLVPLRLSLRRRSLARFPLQSIQNPPRRPGLRPVRQVRQGLPAAASRRSPRPGPLRRMHRLPGVRRQLRHRQRLAVRAASARRSAHRLALERPRPPARCCCPGPGCAILRRSFTCSRHPPLADQSLRRCLPPTRPAGRPTDPSRLLNHLHTAVARCAAANKRPSPEAQVSILDISV